MSTIYNYADTKDEAQKIFKLPRCSKQFPRDIGKSRPCLNHHIGLCSAPCSGKIKQTDYLESVKSAVEFIKGGSAETAAVLQKKMEDIIKDSVNKRVCG